MLFCGIGILGLFASMHIRVFADMGEAASQAPRRPMV